MMSANVDAVGVEIGINGDGVDSKFEIAGLGVERTWQGIGSLSTHCTASKIESIG